MVDLGVYNFVKNGLAAGKSAEDITADLTRGGQKAATIEEALDAVQSGTLPAAPIAPPTPVINIGITSRAPSAPVERVHGATLFVSLALIFALIGGIAFILGPRLSQLQGVVQKVHDQYQTSRTHIPGDSSRPASTQ